jgi:16S rRNA (cytidine1402-2'-O)-methyltransferase
VKRGARNDRDHQGGARRPGPDGAATRPDAIGPLGLAVTGEVVRQYSAPLAPGLYIVATPIGNLGDITVRAIATLARVDLVCCEDTRHSRTLLNHYAISGPTRAYHEHNADAERPRLLALLAEGRSIALISDAGTPLISDPGYKLVRAALEAGHTVHAVPGPSAIMAGLTVSGLPTDAFFFAGFLPTRETARRTRLSELAPVPATLVLFEAPNRLAAALTDIAATLGARDVSVARELTKRFEEVRRGKAEELAEWASQVDVKGEVVILIAPPTATEVGDADIEAALEAALGQMSLRDAARVVAEATGAPRSRVYDLALKRKAPP